MRDNTRLSDAIHTIGLLYVRRADDLTSTQIAGSVNTNPVVIRRLIGDLKRAGLINSTQGGHKLDLTREPKDITVLDVYQAVDDSQLLRIDTNTNQNCIIGGNIQAVLGDYYADLAAAMKAEMAKTTMADMIDKILAEADWKQAQRDA